MVDVSALVEAIDVSLAELLASESPESSWNVAMAALNKIEDLYLQARYDVWTLQVSVLKCSNCPLLGCELQACGVLLDDTQEPVSFEYLSIQLQRARETMDTSLFSEYSGKTALKMLENPFTRQIIKKITPVKIDSEL